MDFSRKITGIHLREGDCGQKKSGRALRKEAPSRGNLLQFREHFSASMASTTIRAYSASPGSATSMV